MCTGQMGREDSGEAGVPGISDGGGAGGGTCCGDEGGIV